MPPLLYLLAALADATVALTVGPTVVLDVPRIRLADVAAPADLPRRAWDRLADEVIATLPAGKGAVTLSRKAILSLIVRHMPKVRALAGPGADAIRFEINPELSDIAPLSCRRLGRTLRTYESVREADLVPASCSSDRPAELWYDRQDHRLAATRDLPAGSYLGHVTAPPAAEVRRGDGLRLVSRIGPVTVERAVTAMQTGRNGRPVFVRDADGEVFAVKVDRAEAGR